MKIDKLKHAGKRLDRGVNRLLKQNTSLQILKNNSESRNHEDNDILKSTVKRSEG